MRPRYANSALVLPLIALVSIAITSRARALALDPLTSTLWLTSGSQTDLLQQYTKAGVLLGSTLYSALATKNIFGGEFQFVLPGDADMNGRVDFSDLLLLAQHYGQTGGATFARGDFNGDGGVGFDDLLLLAQHYGQSLATSSLPASSASPVGLGAVPEPAAFTLLCGAALALARRRETKTSD